MSTSRERFIRGFQIYLGRQYAKLLIKIILVVQFVLLILTAGNGVAVATPGDIQATDRYNPSVLYVQDGTSTQTPTTTQGVGNPVKTHTPTITRTSQASSPSQTPTLAGSNPYPPPTQLPGQTDLPPGFLSINETVIPAGGTITATVAATTTLIPFPTIELEFPQSAGMSVPTPPIDKTTLPGISWFTPTRLLLILFVTFMWIFLAGWYYFSLRKMS